MNSARRVGRSQGKFVRANDRAYRPKLAMSSARPRTIGRGLSPRRRVFRLFMTLNNKNSRRREFRRFMVRNAYKPSPGKVVFSTPT